MNHPKLSWKCRDRLLRVGERTFVMGILNVTPDSFSDGGRYLDSAKAVAHALEMVRDGADIIDVGGESTRPGSEEVPVEEELRRVSPVIEALARDTGCVISIDTRKAKVARRALELGAHVVNDVSALTGDPDMPSVVRDFQAGVVLMHLRGNPKTMQENPQYADVVKDVTAYLESRIRALSGDGFSPEAVAVDPGIGFGKALEHNLALIANLDRLQRLGRPVVVGLSRKSFIGKVTGREVQDRLPGSLGVLAYAVVRGAQIVRVHDVKESCDVVRLVDMLRREESP